MVRRTAVLNVWLMILLLVGPASAEGQGGDVGLHLWLNNSTWKAFVRRDRAVGSGRANRDVGHWSESEHFRLWPLRWWRRRWKCPLKIEPLHLHSIHVFNDDGWRSPMFHHSIQKN